MARWCWQKEVPLLTFSMWYRCVCRCVCVTTCRMCRCAHRPSNGETVGPAGRCCWSARYWQRAHRNWGWRGRDPPASVPCGDVDRSTSTAESRVPGSARRVSQKDRWRCRLTSSLLLRVRLPGAVPLVHRWLRLLWVARGWGLRFQLWEGGEVQPWRGRRVGELWVPGVALRVAVIVTWTGQLGLSWLKLAYVVLCRVVDDAWSRVVVVLVLVLLTIVLSAHLRRSWRVAGPVTILWQAEWSESSCCSGLMQKRLISLIIRYIKPNAPYIIFSALWMCHAAMKSHIAMRTVQLVQFKSSPPVHISNGILISFSYLKDWFLILMSDLQKTILFKHLILTKYIIDSRNLQVSSLWKRLVEFWDIELILNCFQLKL